MPNFGAPFHSNYNKYTVHSGSGGVGNYFFFALTHVLVSPEVRKLPKCGLQVLKTFKNGHIKPQVRPTLIGTKQFMK